MVYKDTTESPARRLSVPAVIVRLATGTYADLAALTLLFALTLIVVYSPSQFPAIVRLGLALIMIMLLPGYAFIAAVFPGKADIGGIVRVILAVAFSIILVSLLGLVLDKTIWGIRLNPVMISVTLLTAVCTFIAFFRRHLLPSDRRLDPGLAGPLKEAKQYLFPPSRNGIEWLSTFLLIGAFLLAASSVALAIYGPGHSEKYTELYVTGPGGKIQDYPVFFPSNATRAVNVGIGNHEGMDKVYDLVVRFEGPFEYDLYNEQIPVRDDQTVQRNITMKLVQPYESARITFSLYTDPDHLSPYRQCYLLLNGTVPDLNTSVSLDGSVLNSRDRLFRDF